MVQPHHITLWLEVPYKWMAKHNLNLQISYSSNFLLLLGKGQVYLLKLVVVQPHHVTLRLKVPYKPMEFFLFLRSDMRCHWFVSHFWLRRDMIWLHKTSLNTKKINLPWSPIIIDNRKVGNYMKPVDLVYLVINWWKSLILLLMNDTSNLLITDRAAVNPYWAPPVLVAIEGRINQSRLEGRWS